MALSREEIEAIVTEASPAPSIHDSQPWHWRVRDGRLELFADPARLLGVIDPDGRQLLISCGAALFHARIAMRARGMELDVVLLPDGPGYADLDMDLAGKEPLATIRVTGTRAADAGERALAAAMHARHTDDRRPVRPRLPAAGALDAVRCAAEAEGCWLAVVDDTALAALLDSTTLVGGAQRYGIVLDTAPDAPRPVIVALGTDADRPVDRLAAGQALARVLLTAAALGLAASPLGCAEDIDAIRVMLRELLRSNGHVQMIIRVGRPAQGNAQGTAPVEPVRRRPVAEILEVMD